MYYINITQQIEAQTFKKSYKRHADIQKRGGELMEKYILLNKTKDEILKEMTKEINSYFRGMERMGFKKHHSPEFFSVLKSLFEELAKQIENAVLIEPLPYMWGYEWRIDFFKIELRVTHHVIEDNRHYVDQTFSLISVPVPVLTAEEFATRCNVKIGTVSQWIRRNRIRTAYKVGRIWWISALTDRPGRGYTDSEYKIPEKVYNVPDKFLPLITNTSRITIHRDIDDINIYHLAVYDKEKCVKKLIFGPDEREEFESFLISNPSVEYVPEYKKSVFGEIVSLLRNAKWEWEDE